MELLLDLINEGLDSSLLADAYSERSCSNQWTDTSLKLSVEPGVKAVPDFKMTKVRAEPYFCRYQNYVLKLKKLHFYLLSFQVLLIGGFLL